MPTRRCREERARLRSSGLLLEVVPVRTAVADCGLGTPANGRGVALPAKAPDMLWMWRLSSTLTTRCQTLLDYSVALPPPSQAFLSSRPPLEVLRTEEVVLRVFSIRVVDAFTIAAVPHSRMLDAVATTGALAKLRTVSAVALVVCAVILPNVGRLGRFALLVAGAWIQARVDALAVATGLLDIVPARRALALGRSRQ